MVVVRTLASAPHTLTSSPSTRQVASSPPLHRAAVGSNVRASSLRGGGELKCLSADGTSPSPKESRLQSSLVLTNARPLERCSAKTTSKRSARLEIVAQTAPGVRSLSTAASSRGLSISFPVTVAENTPLDTVTQAAVDQIKIDGPLVLSKLAKTLHDSKTRETLELSLLLCDDPFIEDLNSKWKGKKASTNILSFPQDQGPGLRSHLLLGDIVISLDTAARQAAAHGHTILDELRILLVHGVVRVLGHEHEIGKDASSGALAKETQLLKELGWKGKPIIDAPPKPSTNGAAVAAPVKKRSVKPPFKILFCDMDGTLLNEKAQVSDATADALRAAMAKGVQVIIATGKTQYGAMAALKPVGLTGEGGVISYTSPGVFLQGLSVYGPGGSVLYTSVLDQDVVRDAFLYSIEHGHPAAGFCGSRCVALKKSSLTEVLHTVYVESEAEIIPSLDVMMETSPVQKFLFYDTPELIKYKVRPHWEEKYKGRVTCVQALDDMLEMLPPKQSKGAGVKMLLDHIGIPLSEVMALGDGENDIEMLKLAGWGVAMANGSPATKHVANALTASNIEDGAAQAIHKYILS